MNYDPYGPDPMILTQEELDELTKLWEIHINANDHGYNPNHRCEPPEWYDLDYAKPRTRKRHKWKPVLLLIHTEFNCEHCGIKREDAKGEFCEDQF